MRATLAIFLLVAFAAFAVDVDAVTIDWVPVGNAGNANDTIDGDSVTLGVQHLGGVNYAFDIDKFDVTNNQYCEFLNAVDPTGSNVLHLWNFRMRDMFIGGITAGLGNADGSKYTVLLGRGNHPVGFVSWYDAVRFANWLNNGQGSASTETGAYTLLGGTPTPSNSNSIVRNAGAKVFLPSENEWYKAAYYNSDTQSYFKYATSSNTAPTASPPTALANHANYTGAGTGITDVGAYSGTTSPYGAFDMLGNLKQWTEDPVSLDPTSKIIRGVSYSGGSIQLPSSFASAFGAADSDFSDIFGFRVASIPEPSTGLLAVIACSVLLWWRWRLT